MAGSKTWSRKICQQTKNIVFFSIFRLLSSPRNKIIANLWKHVNTLRSTYRTRDGHNYLVCGLWRWFRARLGDWAPATIGVMAVGAVFLVAFGEQSSMSEIALPRQCCGSLGAGCRLVRTWHNTAGPSRGS